MAAQLPYSCPFGYLVGSKTGPCTFIPSLAQQLAPDITDVATLASALVEAAAAGQVANVKKLVTQGLFFGISRTIYAHALRVACQHG